MRQLRGVEGREDQLRGGLAGSTGVIDEAIDLRAQRAIRELPSRPVLREAPERDVTTALLLAAGRGTRLLPRTSDSPKCLTEVCGIPILGRLVSGLVAEGFERLVVVVGHRGEKIREYLDRHALGLDIQCIECPRYATTNNIYSLWVASEHLREPFALIESDLVFDSRLLGMMRTSNRIAVARFRSNMDGTTVSFDSTGRLASFRVGATLGDRLAYKTVNLYSFSTPLWQEIGRRLEQRIRSGRVHDYYEVVFAEMAREGLLPLQAVSFDDGRWYEIDTSEDLAAAAKIFSESA